MSNYRAFISYSHSDQPFAIRLQRSLENYRIPGQIVSQLKLESNKLAPIFRDTSDLAAAPALTEALKDALKNSTALIVICSPLVASSAWVDQEIEAGWRTDRSVEIRNGVAEGETVQVNRE